MENINGSAENANNQQHESEQNFVDRFMRKLHEQAHPERDPASVDKDISRIVVSWMEKKTNDYLNHIRLGNTDVSFLASRLSKACVSKEIAWEFVKKVLGNNLNQGQLNCLQNEFNTAFDNTKADFGWRNRIFKSVL